MPVEVSPFHARLSVPEERVVVEVDLAVPMQRQAMVGVALQSAPASVPSLDNVAHLCHRQVFVVELIRRVMVCLLVVKCGDCPVVGRDSVVYALRCPGQSYQEVTVVLMALVNHMCRESS